MATPFDTNTTPATGSFASDAQIERAIVPMLADRDWQSGPAKFATRIAAINVVLQFVTGEFDTDRITDPALLDILGDDSLDLGRKLNRALALCGVSAEPGYEFAYAPLTRKGASLLIDHLGSLQFKGGQSKVEEANVAAAKKAVADKRSAAHEVTAEMVPAGRYAVATEAGAVNELAFYKVDRPTEGRWAGFVFVKHIVGDNEQRMSQAAGKAILRKIAHIGAEAAMAAYGHEIGECGACGKTLTNDESRERGIGPICMERLGW